MVFQIEIIREDGFSTMSDKIQVAKRWSVPLDSKQLWSLLGFMNYQRNHILVFAKVSADLHELLLD